MKKSKIHESSLGGVFMSVTLGAVSYFVQKVRCEPSPPHIRAKRQIFAFNIGSPVGFVPAGLFSCGRAGGGESCGKCWC